MIVAIHQPHYLPWLRYMHKLASCDVFVILDDVQFTKNGWQNRNKIKGSQGPVLLTVPVSDASFKPLSTVKVDDQTHWREKHWKSLQTSYGRAPFFARYSSTVKHAFAKRWDLLAPLNCQLLEGLCREFGVQTQLILSSTLSVSGGGTERLVEICRRLNATHYLTGAFAAIGHLDAHLFADAGVTVVTQVWECPSYHQQFPALGFVPELSSVDLLFNEGPNSLRVLLGGPQRPARPRKQAQEGRRSPPAGGGRGFQLISNDAANTFG